MVSPITRKAWIVGGGPAAAATAMFLRKAGIEPVVLERAAVPGGLVRSDRMNGVIYEPSGSHIFHTDDEEVWRIVTGLVPFNGYEHRVQTMVEGRLVRWPIMQEDLEQLSFGPHALALLPDERAPLPRGAGVARRGAGGAVAGRRSLRDGVPTPHGARHVRGVRQAVHREAVGPT